MSESDDPNSDVSRFEGQSHHGWAPDVDADDDTAATAGEKARQTPVHEVGKDDRPVSEEERQGVSPTEMEPGSPFGSGDSSTRRGEEIAAEGGNEPEGHKGESQRPYGQSG